MFHRVQLYGISMRVVCAHCCLHMLMLGVSNCRFGYQTILMQLQSVNKKMITNCSSYDGHSGDLQKLEPFWQ